MGSSIHQINQMLIFLKGKETGLVAYVLFFLLHLEF